MSRNVDRVASTRKSFNYVTDNETLAALGFPQHPATNSAAGQLAQQAGPDAVSATRENTEFPSRRSLRSTAVVPGAADAVASPSPAQPGSRRAAREAREAVAIPTPASLGHAPQLAAPTAASPVTAPQVAAPFGTFELAPAAVTADQRPRGRRAPSAPTAPPSRAVTSGVERRAGGTRKRLSVAGTMVLVGGLFVSLTLPAYASADYTGELAEAAAASDGQSLALKADVDATAAVAADSRDAYDTVSASDLKRLYRDALKQKRMAEYLASGAQALGDDYPWATDLGMSQGGGLSPLRYFVRQCVDFVAWRLNRDAGSYGAPFKYDWSSLTPGGGNASSWKRQWENHGWATSSTPSPGWVAWFPGANHVAYVNSVLANGSVLIEEYNWGGADVYNQRIIDAGSAVYLSPPPR